MKSERPLPAARTRLPLTPGRLTAVLPVVNAMPVGCAGLDSSRLELMIQPFMSDSIGNLCLMVIGNWLLIIFSELAWQRD